MPLYESIVISKIGEVKFTKIFMKQISQVIWNNGGLLRDVNVLGDRILSRNIKSKDNKYNLVGRYLQLIFDGSPNVKSEAELFYKNNKIVLNFNTFKMKDFYNEAQSYKKIAAFQSPLVTEQERNNEYLQSIKIALQNKEKSFLNN